MNNNIKGLLCTILICASSQAMALGQNTDDGGWKNQNYSGQTPQSSSYTGQHSGGAYYGTQADFNTTGDSGAARDTSNYSTSPSSGTIDNTYRDVTNATNRMSGDN
ncbi:MAG: hypothetical protein ACXV7J_00165 [Methylomonas sp.]